MQRPHSRVAFFFRNGASPADGVPAGSPRVAAAFAPRPNRRDLRAVQRRPIAAAAEGVAAREWPATP